MNAHRLFFAIFIPFSLAACSGGGDTGGSGGSAGGGGGGGGEGGSGGGSALTQFPSVSECGGFAIMGGSPGAKINPPMADPATYCDAERLLWVYDAATKSLGVSNTRVLLNCCGDHTITVTEENGTYVFLERDAPEAAAGGARCNCNCVFDYSVSVEPIPEGSLPIRLVLDVTDSGKAPEIVYEGALDLTKGSGEVIIDPNTVDPWCGASP